MGGILGIGLGEALGQLHGQQENERTKKLMDIQKGNQKELNEHGAKLQRETWDYTNYENQVKHMENAGLNVGLLYGMGGAGGATTGGQGGGNANGGNAPKVDSAGLMAIGLQNKAIESQIELNKSLANKATKEAGEVEARTPTHAKGMQKTDEEIKEIASRIGVNETAVRKMFQEIEESDSRIGVNDANIENINADTNKKNAETKRIVNITPVEIDNLKADTNKKIWDVKQNWYSLQLDKRKIEIEKFKAEIKAQYPNVSEASGRVIDNVLNELLKQAGVLEYNENSKRRVP